MSRFHWSMHVVCATAATFLAAVLIYTVMTLPSEPAGLARLVEDFMNVSGVEHPVTAVLLNFRGYDTWLELGVLLVAVLGMLLFQRQNDLRQIVRMPAAEPVLDWLIRLIAPMMALVSGYLLWMGKYSSGGAFQAGVVLGAACVLLWLSGHPSLESLSGRVFRFLLTVGFSVFMIAGALFMLSKQPFLTYPVATAGHWILLIETAATFSIAVTVAALIMGLQPTYSETEDQP
jgi:multisubunit Na+/H+ antiporter MnhB subunit